MDDRLINGSPAIHGHQTMGILKMFLRKSTKGFMVQNMNFVYPLHGNRHNDRTDRRGRQYLPGRQFTWPSRFVRHAIALSLSVNLGKSLGRIAVFEKRAGLRKGDSPPLRPGLAVRPGDGLLHTLWVFSHRLHYTSPDSSLSKTDGPFLLTRWKPV